MDDRGGREGAPDSAASGPARTAGSTQAPVGTSDGPSAEWLGGEQRLAFDRAAVGMAILALDGSFLSVNRALCAILGRDMSELHAESFHSLTHAPERLVEEEELYRLLVGDTDHYVVCKHLLRRDGSLVPVDQRVALSRDAEGHPRHLILQVHDLTDRQSAERARRVAEESFRLLIEALPDIVLVVRDSVCIYGNPAALRALNCSAAELAGRALFDLVDLATADGSDARLRAGDRVVPVELKLVPVVFDGSNALLAIVRDMTQQREIQARLAQTDRLVSLGTLAAGMAHEINNPLSYVLGSLELATRALAHPDVDAVASHISRALEGVERVISIARDLRIFARGDIGRPTVVDPAQVVVSTIEMVRAQLESVARLEVQIADVSPVLASEAQLGQVVLNLALNAAQAIPPGSPREHLVRVRLDEDGSGHVVIEISDTGSGIPPDVLPRVFEPFFTTKPVGLGTGLGLAICHGSVQAMGGRIVIESQPGAGSTFRVLLPRLDATMDNAAPASEPLPSSSGEARPRLLVVDDEERLAHTLASLLATDFDVTVATSGEAAYRALRDESFDGVLCDVCMPGMSGTELHAAIAREQPDMGSRFVFMTGAITAEASDYAAPRGLPVVEKPVDHARLLRLLHRRARKRAGGREPV